MHCHLSILSPSDLSAHSIVLAEDANNKQKVDERNEKHRDEPVRDLFVQGHGRAHPQKARSDTVGHRHVVVILARVKKEEGQIVEQGIETAGADRDVVSDESSKWRVEDLSTEDKNVPFERRPRE